MSAAARRLRARVHEVLEVAGVGDVTSRVVDAFLITLVAANILAVILESVQSLSREYDGFFSVFDRFSVAIFSAEYALRIWAAAESDQTGARTSWGRRARYALSPLALADLAAIAPFYISAFVAVDLRFMRVLRLLRIFKLTRYSAAMTMVLRVYRTEQRAFGAALFILLVAMIFAASGIYLAENGAQPEAFGSIPAAMWWAVATLTTVGYGDVTPVTPLGKVFAAAITIVGIGIVALPAGLLASGFSELHRANRSRLAREAEVALEDGVITDDEARALDALSASLGVAPEEAAEILDRARSFEGRVPALDACPHCGKLLI